MDQAFQDHVAGGLTTLASAWALTRGDGVVLGFTDHDCDLRFDGIVFRADSGMTATAVQQGTGLAVDNAEALGALRDDSISEADIDAGRFDGAELRAWIVNWADVTQRHLRFRGGRVYQKPCSAVLGDRTCRFDLSMPGFSADIVLRQIDDEGVMGFDALPGFEAGWFARGRLEVLDGAAAGLRGQIKRDEAAADGRKVALWVPLRAALAVGDRVRLIAGCDKRFDTCRFKFDNALNFRGFPDLPSEDWLMAVPARAGDQSGGSRR